MTEEKDIALVTDYLEGSLGPEEKEQVEKRLQLEADFSALFQDIKQLTGGMERLSHKKLLERMDTLEENLDNPLEKKPETKTVFWTFQRLAAVFIGLAIVAFASWYGLSGSGELNGPILYQQYYQAYDNVMVPITRGEDDNMSLLERAFSAYEQGSYEEADGLFDELLTSEQPVFVSFYAGIAALEANEDEKGKALLEKVMNTDDAFADRARWYLALHHLNKEEYNTTISLLEGLKETESSYAARATELLKELR